MNLRVAVIFWGALIAAGVGIAFSLWSNQQRRPGTPTQAQIAYAENATPNETRLAQIYDRTCRVCHSRSVAGAPLTGRGADWGERIERKGFDGLLASAKSGLGAMPVRGLCLDCSDADLVGLIEFMTKEGS